MLVCDHSGGIPLAFIFLPSEGEAADMLDEISRMVRGGLVDEIKEVTWTLSHGLNAHVILKEPVQVYPINDNCSHTGESEDPYE